MCWFSHDLEPYAFKVFSRRIMLAWILFGSVSPDIFTKFFIESRWIPTYQHRHVGIGITHTPFFGVAVSALLYLLLRRRISEEYARSAALSFLLGQWSHVVLDTLDSVGLMALFPLSTRLFSAGLWSYAAQLGHWGDLYVFYHSPAILIETTAFVAVWYEAWRLLTPRYFQRLLAEERLGEVLGVRNGGLLYMLYFYYLVASLRLPAWVYKVWFSYEPGSDALALAARNAWYSQVFSHPPVAIAALTLMLYTIIYTFHKLWRNLGWRGPMLLGMEGILLLLVALAIPYEPLMSALSTITAAATAFLLYHLVIAPGTQ